MSFLTEKKAREIFELYKKAELSGNNVEAAELESQLEAAGWKVASSPDGLTIVKERTGLFAGWGKDNDITDYLPKDTNAAPYRGTNQTGSRTWLYVGIGIGTVVLIIGLILAIKHYKKVKNGGFNRF